MIARKLGLCLALWLSCVASVQGAEPSLREAVDKAFNGQVVNNLTVDKHGFYLRPITVVRLAGSVQIEGTFRHRIVGKDDRIHYKIVVEKHKSPRGVITRIEYRGIKDNSLIKIADKYFPGVSDVAGDAQKWRVGSWEAAAQKVVNAMSQRLAREVAD